MKPISLCLVLLLAVPHMAWAEDVTQGVKEIQCQIEISAAISSLAVLRAGVKVAENRSVSAEVAQAFGIALDGVLLLMQQAEKDCNPSGSRPIRS